MKFSTKTRYGLRILLQIAETKDKKFVQGKEIARAQKITEPYMEQIMISLKNARLIKTTRGCFGGYALTRSPSEIKLSEIIELFEGPIYFTNCVEDKDSCELINNCKAHVLWKKLAARIKNIFDNISLEEIMLNKI